VQQWDTVPVSVPTPNGFRALAVSCSKIPQVSLTESLRFAKEAEDAGFGIVSAGENSIENFSVLGALAMSTTNVELFSGIASWTRTPVTTAIGASTIDDLSGGRYRLGLGPMPRPWSEGWHDVEAAHPVDRMRDFVGAIRAAWRALPGRPVDYEGSFYRFRGFEPIYGPERIGAVPIYLAATRRRMARLGGEIGDGLIFNTMSSLEWVRDALWPQVERGLEASGRSRADLDTGIVRICIIDDDRARAFETGRNTLGFYFRVP
jgi:alkanesulfonate monooxygenase SsuD/methylene tetrahydromethanopterin reductase-like flavin-dependent oxidoreductase (luciferase family)